MKTIKVIISRDCLAEECPYYFFINKKPKCGLYKSKLIVTDQGIIRCNGCIDKEIITAIISIFPFQEIE